MNPADIEDALTQLSLSPTDGLRFLTRLFTAARGDFRPSLERLDADTHLTGIVEIALVLCKQLAAVAGEGAKPYPDDAIGELLLSKAMTFNCLPELMHSLSPTD
jgi:hypothetical protein